MACILPEEVRRLAIEDVGSFFEPLSGMPKERAADDHLNMTKSVGRAALLERYAPMRGQRVLEIGSGFGTNLATWITDFGVDGFGVEPASHGFEKSFRASRLLFEANGLDPSRIHDAAGENLPFSDASFDIVYSANVLEHTADPSRVLREAARVLKPGGICHMEIPNYLSYFEGHYMIPQPPVWSNRVLALWVKLFGRDPAFVSTLRLTNPIWCRRAVREVNLSYPVQLVSLGDDVFLEKLARPFEFQTQAAAGKLGTAIKLMQRMNWGNWCGRLIVALQGYYPIYLTFRRA